MPLPVTLIIEPSNVNPDCTVAFVPLPLYVITPLVVVPVKVTK